MEKLRVSRVTRATHGEFDTLDTQYIWIGLDALQLAQDYPRTDDHHDPLHSSFFPTERALIVTHFEAYEKGTWSKITDPRPLAAKT